MFTVHISPIITITPDSQLFRYYQYDSQGFCLFIDNQYGTYCIKETTFYNSLQPLCVFCCTFLVVIRFTTQHYRICTLLYNALRLGTILALSFVVWIFVVRFMWCDVVLYDVIPYLSNRCCIMCILPYCLILIDIGTISAHIYRIGNHR